MRKTIAAIAIAVATLGTSMAAAGPALAQPDGASAKASTASQPQKAAVQAGAAKVDCSVHSDGKLWCGNRGGAKMYWYPRYNSEWTSNMNSTYSWFECWQYGEWHSGGNNIWYFSTGDTVVSHGGRGYLPAVDIWTRVDPAPGLQQCIFDRP